MKVFEQVTKLGKVGDKQLAAQSPEYVVTKNAGYRIVNDKKKVTLYIKKLCRSPPLSVKRLSSKYMIVFVHGLATLHRALSLLVSYDILTNAATDRFDQRHSFHPTM